ncbi:MAG: ADOP family duplicated permease [Bryobacteraceae bacterium]|nr:ADOP family duplicated permease [Bryobacteraceae bacterium]
MSWFSRLRNVFRPDDLDRDLAEELRFHADQRAAELGIPASEAAARLGNVRRLEQESRDVKQHGWLASVVQDLRLSLRLWRKHPVTAAASILTIAIAGGLAMAAFQLVWNVLLRPLPYGQPDRLAQIWLTEGTENRRSPRNEWLDEWRDASRAFSHLVTYRQWRVTILEPHHEPELVNTLMISSEFFAALQVKLRAGRPFTRPETQPGADAVVILRGSAARKYFPGRGSALDEELDIDGVRSRVVGIVDDGFESGPLVQLARGLAVTGRNPWLESDVFLPISRALSPGSKTPMRVNFAFGRLANGVPLDDAARELATLSGTKLKGRLWLSPLAVEFAYRLRPALLALLGAAGCVLLIACANLANLLLVQTLLRQRELAVRAALGAGRARLVRQLLTEAGLLALAGGLGGLYLAQVFTSALIRLYPDAVARVATIGMQPAVYAFGFGITLLAGLAIGALPAFCATRDSAASLRVGQVSLSANSRWWAGSLVAGQVGLTTLLLCAAGLLLQSFLAMRAVDLGLERDHLVTTSVTLPITRYPKREDRAAFATQWLERLAAIPGVESVGVSNSLPLRYTTLLNVTVRVPGWPGEQEVGGRAVGGDYFRAFGMRFAAGRAFDPGHKFEVVVNEAFAAKYLRSRDVVGRQLPQGKFTYTIAGVLKDVRLLGLREAAPPEIYFSYPTFPLNPLDTVLRTRLPLDRLNAALRRELKLLDSEIPLAPLTTMDALVDSELARPRFQAGLVLLFAASMLGLAALGTYGVIAHQVRGRLAEFGLRRALGASSPALLRLVVWDGMKGPLVGLLLGLALSVVWLGRVLESVLYGVGPREPLVFGAAGLLLAVTSLLACLPPARAAIRLDPLAALRRE